MPTLDVKLKEELINCKNSFFIPYKKNAARISQTLDILSGANTQLEAYLKQLEKVKGTAKMFPELATPEESAKLWKEEMNLQQKRAAFFKEREIAEKSEFGKVMDQVHEYLHGVLLVSVLNYEIQVTQPIKRMLAELKINLDKVLDMLNNKYIVLKFNRSELDAINTFSKMTIENCEEFEKELENLTTAIFALKKHRPSIIFKRIKPSTPSGLVEDYKKFIKENKVRIIRLADAIKSLQDSIKFLDIQTGNLIKALEKAY